MNFQNLEYFVAVARERNITRAAEDLNITQQALSNQISRLEQELGCALFDRKHGLELTYSGKCFFDSALKIIDINNETEKVIHDIAGNRRGELRVGMAFTRGLAILPLVFPEYRKRHPEVSLKIVEDISIDLEEVLDNGDLDLIIGYTPFRFDSIASVNLLKEHLYLVVPKSILQKLWSDDYDLKLREFNSKPDITLFKDFPFILLKHGEKMRDLVDREFRFHGISPEILAETENIQTCFALCAEGMGITVVPELYVKSPYVISGNTETSLRKNVELLRFSDNDIRNTINMAIGYNEERYLSHNAKEFISMCTRKFSEL